MPKSERRLSKRFLERLLKRPEWIGVERDIVLKWMAKNIYRFQAEYGLDVSKWGWARVPRDVAVLEGTSDQHS